MNMQMKNLMLVLIITLLLAACGGVETTSAPVEMPEPVVVVTESPTSIPTTIPPDGLAPNGSSKYIGLIYPPSPEGLTEVFSMLIQNKEDHSLMMVLEGGNKMLWLNKIDHYDENGSAFWEVKDVLALSNLEPGLTLLPDGCSLNGALDNEIIVAGRNGVVILAWRANMTLDKFEVIPIDGIQCNSDKAVSLE